MSFPQGDSPASAPNAIPGVPTEIPGADESGVIRTILVDDDDFYREAVSTELSHLGFHVSAFPSGEPMLAHLDESVDAEVIILDWRLQNGLGIDLLPRLKDRGIDLPVVFLTGVAAVAAEYTALDLGAVDFVDKARGTAILAKRLQLIVQGMRERPRSGEAEIPTSEPLIVGKLELKPGIGRAYWDGVDVDLTFTEFKIVSLLASHAGQYVTYRAVYDCVRYEGFVAGTGEDGYRTNVRSSIKRIRNKFRDLDNDFADIENYPAFGYRWRESAVNGG